MINLNICKGYNNIPCIKCSELPKILLHGENLKIISKKDSKQLYNTLIKRRFIPIQTYNLKKISINETRLIDIKKVVRDLTLLAFNDKFMFF